MSCKNLKISEMPIVKKLQASDVLPIVQDGKNYTISIKQLLQLFHQIRPIVVIQNMIVY